MTLRFPAMMVALSAVVVVGLGAPRIARADSADEARATQLFEEGRALAREGHCAEAIPIFLASVKHVPGVGTFLNLGSCYEELGQTMTAHRWFVRAKELAVSRNDPRRAEAHERAHALQKKLSRLTIRVAPDVAASESDLVLKLDGEAFPRERWNVAEPVDPGVHELEAISPRRSKAILRVTVRADADNAELVVPVIVSPSRASSTEPDPTPTIITTTTTGMGTQRILGWSLGGVGATALAIGGVFGVLSLVDHGSLTDRCPSYPTCDASRRAELDDLNDSARAKGTVSSIAIVSGAVLVASGIILLLTAPTTTTRERASAASCSRCLQTTGL
jgi:hypothetical protein